MDNFVFETVNNDIFDTEKGKHLLETVSATMKELSMEDFLKRGVAVGFSGGADSVFLLLALKHLSKKLKMSLAAVHVNHMIRGEEADYDELFSKNFCDAIDVPFFAYNKNVPQFANDRKLGLEEAAREVRYNCFEEFIQKNDEYKTVATAHNATDNTETVLFNLFRGSGALGVSGIAPIRGNIIRPIIRIAKAEIVEFLQENNIPYVFDSSNLCNDYSRNFIRNEILPKIKTLNPNLESSITKFTGILKENITYIERISRDFIAKNNSEGRVDAVALSEEDDAVISTVIGLMAKDFGVRSIEFIHIRKIRSLLKRGGDFRCDTPCGASFVCRSGYCQFEIKSDDSDKPAEFRRELSVGLNYVDEINAVILLSYEKNDIFSSNVYNFSIQVNLGFDILLNGLYVRNREDGDSYRYGGITRKLKKLFNDRKLSLVQRNKIPVICDSEGILWVPGFGVRDAQNKPCDGKPIYASIYVKERCDLP